MTNSGNFLGFQASWYIDFKICICYNAIRRKDKSVQSGTKTNPSGAGTPEGFYSIWARWLKPLADYLTRSVQPLAYVIGDYTCHDGHKKRQKYIQNGTPPFCTCLGVVAVLVYHKDKIIKSHL